uniref:Uncharacterized protein n=1 Tax=Cyclophora tenuis TaxID=216820 RepID=A0A6U1RPN2_CYCTE|mmetsp:Transcript_24678/g.41984  ORF Transcript_24678/g.41984 Transcript_24678/m.41984 type:complete len:280 (+) Transcript_24678:125-964(+)
MIKASLLFLFLSMVPHAAQASAILTPETCTSIALGVAQFGTVLTVASQLGSFFAPKTILNLYKAPTGPMNTHLMRFVGTAGLAYAIILVCSLFFNMSYTSAVGYSLVPWIASGVRDAVARVDKSLGLHPINFMFNLLMGPLIAYVCLYGTEYYADLVARVFGGFMTLNGLTMTFATDSHVKAWGGNTPDNEPILSSSLRTFGLHMLAYGLLMEALQSGMNVVPALGLTWVFLAACPVLPLLSSTAKKFKLSAKLLVALTLPNAIIIGGTALYYVEHKSS